MRDAYQKLVDATQEVMADTSINATERRNRVRDAFRRAGYEGHMEELAAYLAESEGEADKPTRKR